MTIRKHAFAKTAAPNQLIVAGSFIPNGSGTIATKYGKGFTVSRASTGIFTVTFDQPFRDFVSLTVTGQFASSDDDGHQFQIGDISVANKTFKILHLKSTDVSSTDIALADISTSGTANKINFIAVLAEARGSSGVS
jgi:hypothetical protein